MPPPSDSFGALQHPQRLAQTSLHAQAQAPVHGLPGAAASFPALPSAPSFPARVDSMSVAPPLFNFDNPNLLLGRADSMQVSSQQPLFQFKFEPRPKADAEVSPHPCAAHAGVDSCRRGGKPTTRSGRLADVLERFRKPEFGVLQEPISVSAQADDCALQCRKEVEAIASECKQRGVKYSDPDFPPSERSLYLNGRCPSTGSCGPLEAQPKTWRRVSDGALEGVPGGRCPTPRVSGVPGADERYPPDLLVPGLFQTVCLLGGLAAARAAGREPRDLIAWRDAEAGIFGVQFFKDGEWCFEVLDDFLPLAPDGRPACSSGWASHSGGEVADWPALIEKAYAKVHGSYEAAALCTEAEALEDVVGFGACRVEVRDFPIWGELWQQLRSKTKRGFTQLAVRRKEAPGEVLTSGLFSCFGYPLLRVELIDGEMLCELDNPWSTGAWNGRWSEVSKEFAAQRSRGLLHPSPGSCRPFWMSIQDFCKHFTFLAEARCVTSFWQSAAVACSIERLSYPLLSAPSATQAIFVLTQRDRRLTGHDDYPCSMGLRIFRCRIVAPPRHAAGLRQNVSSPFRNLELLAERPPTPARTVVLEVARMEADCLYIAAPEFQPQCDYAVLRVLTAVVPRFRELSAPEFSYFLQAQGSAPVAPDSNSFSSQGSLNGSLPDQGPVWTRGFREVESPGHPGDSLSIDGEDADSDDAVLKMPRMLQAFISSCSGTLHC